MRACAFGLLLAALLASGVEARGAEPIEAGETEAAGSEYPSAARADRVVLEDVYRESGAARIVPGPAWWDYVAALASKALDWLFKRLDPLGQLVGPWSRVIASVLAATLIVVFLLILVRLLIRLGDTKAGRKGGASVISRPDPAHPRSREEWRRELEVLLGHGETLPALRALWWWFALSASPAGVDPSWTSGEVLSRAGRTELRPFAQVLDRMIYGSRTPQETQIRALLADMEATLA